MREVLVTQDFGGREAELNRWIVTRIASIAVVVRRAVVIGVDGDRDGQRFIFVGLGRREASFEENCERSVVDLDVFRVACQCGSTGPVDPGSFL